MFVVYKNIGQFLGSKGKEKESEMVVNSNIVSFKMNRKEDVTYLQETPIEITFVHSMMDSGAPVCSFWDYQNE